MRCSTSQDLLQSGGNMCFIEAFIYCFGSLKGTAGSALLCKNLRRFIAFFIYLLTLGIGPLPTVEIILKKAKSLSNNVSSFLLNCLTL